MLHCKDTRVDKMQTERFKFYLYCGACSVAETCVSLSFTFLRTLTVETSAVRFVRSLENNTQLEAHVGAFRNPDGI